MAKRREMVMSNEYLTADEIYTIDKLTEIELPDYLISLPPEKRQLVSHIFSKNRAASTWKAIAAEKDEGVKRRHKLLEEKGLTPV